MSLRAAFLLLLCLVPLACAEPPALLTTAREIRALTPEEAAREIPVKLRGVVLVHDPIRRATFIHDGTDGIYVRVQELKDPPALHPGQLLEIEGVSSPGKYLPDIGGGPKGLLRLSVLGEAPLPEPVRLTAPQFAEPGQNSRWVEIEAFIEQVAAPTGLVEMQARAGAFAFTVFRTGPATPEEVPWHLQQRRVRLRGVCSTVFNLHRQMTGRIFYLGEIEELDPPVVPRDTEAWPLCRADDLFRVSFTALAGVRVRGTVTAIQPGTGLYLRGAGGGLCALTARPAGVHVGSLVEVAGVPQLAPLRPVLRAIDVRVLGDETPPAPLPVRARDAVEGRPQHDLVRLEGELVAVRPTPGGLLFELRDERLVFPARLAAREPDPALLALRPGSRLRVDGICVAEKGNLASTPQTGDRFEVQLRDAADLAVLTVPPWWTKERIVTALGILLVIALAAVAWAVTLRRRVARQAVVIREQAERSVQVQERMRIANDLHDDLGARVTRIGMLSALATRTGDPRANLDAIRDASREAVQALDAAVWSVNPDNDQLAGLTTYFHHFAEELLSAAHIAGRFDLAELPPEPLAVEVRRHLFLAFREAVTNAVKHSAATEVSIAIARRNGDLHVRIADNGHGFDPGQSTAPGHHGVASMHDRMARVGGRFDLRSGESGTAVEFTVPLAAGEKSHA